MSAANSDTLTYARKLQEAGFTPQQAEAQAEALLAVVDEKLATKRDLKEMETLLLHKMELMRRDIIIWLGGLIILATTALAGLMKLL